MRSANFARQNTPSPATAVSPTFASARPRALVFVEGLSDQIALETLAARRGRDLAGEGVSIVRTNGAHGLSRLLGELGSDRHEVRLAGLCDAGEEPVFRRALERAGFGSALSRPELERLGFFTCVEDLEDELIRSIGTAGVEAVLDTQDELGRFRMFQQQPAQRGRPVSAQLRRFLGTRSGRKAQYARLLVDALAPARVPHPLDGVLATTVGWAA